MSPERELSGPWDQLIENHPKLEGTIVQIMEAPNEDGLYDPHALEEHLVPRLIGQEHPDPKDVHEALMRYQKSWWRQNNAGEGRDSPPEMLEPAQMAGLIRYIIKIGQKVSNQSNYTLNGLQVEPPAPAPAPLTTTEQRAAQFARDHPEKDEEGYLQVADADDQVTQYLKEAARTPLLTAKQEVDLAQRMEAGKYAHEALGSATDDARKKG